MLWELEIRPTGKDGERERVCDEFDLLTHGERGGDLISASARGFLLEGELSDEQRARLARNTSGFLVVAIGHPIAAVQNEKSRCGNQRQNAGW